MNLNPRAYDRIKDVVEAYTKFIPNGLAFRFKFPLAVGATQSTIIVANVHPRLLVNRGIDMVCWKLQYL